ncbi:MULTISPECIES: ead/Ea22-like family protein [unclassified Enterobacter]|uniref:ead/Ea22-like family protein n=1 Tax=unclassified Enterobacter TaxID=2608935 RepID=UPI00201713F5|nr:MULTISPECIES: ead/Ea22-like family protein [unclassified Enterobacter]
MSNIDKRALREIAEAAVGAHERLSVMPPDDIFDISLAEGTQLDADITALNALNSAANPTTVLALLDELEAGEKRIAEQREYYESVIADGSMRIASLDARTLTVKLPQRATAGKYVDEEFNNSDLAAIYNSCRLECEVKFKDACAAAGIKLQIEGE